MLRAIDRIPSNFDSAPSRLTAIVVVLWCLLIGAASVANAQSEDQVKAAFLFNFARYVEWPSDAFPSDDSAVRICMIGTNGFSGVVSNTVSGKSVGNRSVEVDTPADLSGASGCHILYVGEGIQAKANEVASSVAGANVFTVADRVGFAQGGGIANFIRTDKKIRFEINPGAAKKAGLKISSRLLRLAKVVK